jgi:hypothetical protein
LTDKNVNNASIPARFPYTVADASVTSVLPLLITAFTNFGSDGMFNEVDMKYNHGNRMLKTENRSRFKSVSGGLDGKAAAPVSGWCWGVRSGGAASPAL